MTWPPLDTSVKRALASAAALAAAFVVTRAVLSRVARPPQIAEASAGQAVKWMLNKAGDISQLRLVPVPPSSVARDCVRVAVRFVGLNFADICACQGLCVARFPQCFIVTSCAGIPPHPVAPSHPDWSFRASSLRRELTCAHDRVRCCMTYCVTHHVS
jgi:hypothetical protein